MLRKVLQTKLFSDNRLFIFEKSLNQFLESHNVSKVTYAAVNDTDGEVLFTALVVYVEERNAA